MGYEQNNPAMLLFIHKRFFKITSPGFKFAENIPMTSTPNTPHRKPQGRTDGRG
jgi:hypothetical protein